MKIERHELPRATLNEFGVKNGLVMEIHERSHLDSPTRWYAHFKNSDVSEYPFLRGEFGDGPTPEAALSAYAEAISGKVLVIDAHTKKRRDLVVPIITDIGGDWGVG